MGCFTLFKKFLLTSRPAKGPVKQTDFAMYHEDVDIDAYYQSLQKSILKTTTVDRITYRGKTFPILQLDWNETQFDKKLLVIAGVHGDEFAASLAVLDLLADIKKQPDNYEGWSIRILAPVNPVGLACGSRYNEAGYDINRDFKNFRTKGARVQRDAIKDFRPTAVVSLHESPEQGFFMFSEGRLPKHMKASILSRLSEAKIPLAHKSYFRIKLQSGIWEKPPFVFFLQRLLGIHTLGSYVYKRKIPAITTETGYGSKDVATRKKPHLLVIQAIIST